MAEELCPEHGPYKAALGVCPYCSGPPPPSPIGDPEEAVTYPQGAGYQNYQDEENLPTDPGYRGEQHVKYKTGPTILSSERPSKPPTQIGSESRQDVTELYYTPTGMLGLLWVKDGFRRGQVILIENGTVVGRNEGSLILDDPNVSARHAGFVIRDDQFIINDFLSKNGTFVNGDRIKGETTLEENDEIKIGNYLFVLKLLPEVEQ